MAVELRDKKRPRPLYPCLTLTCFSYDARKSRSSNAATKVQANSGKRQNRKSEKMILWSSNLTRRRSVEFEKAVEYEKVEECCHSCGGSRRTGIVKQGII